MCGVNSRSMVATVKVWDCFEDVLGKCGGCCGGAGATMEVCSVLQR